jgi:hypothetical protein
LLENFNLGFLGNKPKNGIFVPHKFYSRPFSYNPLPPPCISQATRVPAFNPVDLIAL